MNSIKILVAVAASAMLAAPLAAQVPANDPSARLEQVLPRGVAAHVLAVIAKARAHDLPTDALANRALKFAAKGVKPDSIARSVSEQETRMEAVSDTLRRARGRAASADEIEAGAEALRKGVDGAKISTLAKEAPSGRSLAIPLYVIGSLVDRGLPSDSALQRVAQRLQARASDRELERLPSELPAQALAHGNRPAETSRDLAGTKRPGSAAGAAQNGNAGGGPPPGVPANGGASTRPTTNPGSTHKPPTPPGKKP